MAALDTSVWNFAEGDGCPNLCGWGNRERQIYTTTNHRLANGLLYIKAEKEGDHFTSTRIHTKGKKAFNTVVLKYAQSLQKDKEFGLHFGF